jgi:hypothetical protein
MLFKIFNNKKWRPDIIGRGKKMNELCKGVQAMFRKGKPGRYGRIIGVK